MTDRIDAERASVVGIDRGPECEIHPAAAGRDRYVCDTHLVFFRDTIYPCLCPQGAVIALTEERDVAIASDAHGDKMIDRLREDLNQARVQRDAAIAERDAAIETLNEKRARQPVWDEIDRIGDELKDIHNGELHRAKAERDAAFKRIGELEEALKRLCDAVGEKHRFEVTIEHAGLEAHATLIRAQRTGYAALAKEPTT